MNDLSLPASPVVGLMLGDPTGIGPEIACRMIARKAWPQGTRVAVIGDARVMKLGQADAQVEFPVRRHDSVEAIDWADPATPLIDLGNMDPAQLPRAQASPEAGRLSGDTLKAMIDLAMAKRLDAVCFAPLNKGAMFKGGWSYHDEHQMFAALTGHQGFYGEMNVIEQFATFRVTSHLSLRKALDLISPERIAAAIRLADRTLREKGIAAPRIGVAALNPHNGENGLFGDEEITMIRPTVEKLAAEGIGCVGPISSDVIFIQARAGRFDGVVMMYHDQGQIATKLLGFNQGVTVTAGLPTVFTTPAHGTAFDIVGQHKAGSGAMEAAMAIAARMAAARKVAQAIAQP
jgi:4-phospho-D-threonate 3-dehydrogenase / 4-phospho-D-erythronate 3-dehydrogenase